MLQKETAEMLGKVLPKGITVKALTKAISSDKEESLELPNGRFITTSDEATLLENHGNTEYHKGKTKEREMLFKEMSKEAGIDKVQDSESFIASFKAHILKDAKIEPAKKVEELTADFKELQGNYKKDKLSWEEKESSYLGQISKIKTNQSILSLLPELSNGISKSDAITLFNANYQVKDDGIYKNGELLKDGNLEPFKLEEVLNGFIKEKGWTKEDRRGRGAGAGAGETHISNITSPEDFYKYCESNSINPTGGEAALLLKEIQEKNTNFKL